MSEEELLRSIEDYNNNLDEINDKVDLRLPSLGHDEKEALAALRRLEDEASKTRTRCLMCDQPIEAYTDSIGRKVVNTTYCGERCTQSGRQLMVDLRLAASVALTREETL